MTAIAAWLTEKFYWLFLAILVLNLTQRRHQKRAEKKRFATLYLAVAALLFYAFVHSIVRFGGRDWMLLPGALATVAILYVLREHTFPFRLRSPVDGRRLTMQEILYDDNHGDGAPDKGERPPDETRGGSP